MEIQIIVKDILILASQKSFFTDFTFAFSQLHFLQLNQSQHVNTAVGGTAWVEKQREKMAVSNTQF